MEKIKKEMKENINEERKEIKIKKDTDIKYLINGVLLKKKLDAKKHKKKATYFMNMLDELVI